MRSLSSRAPRRAAVRRPVLLAPLAALVALGAAPAPSAPQDDAASQDLEVLEEKPIEVHDIGPFRRMTRIDKGQLLYAADTINITDELTQKMNNDFNNAKKK